jgi:hypothetical protein
MVRMKKEGLWLTVVLLFLLFIPGVFAEIVAVELVRPAVSSTEFPTCNPLVMRADPTMFCTDGGRGASLHLIGLNAPASAIPADCTDGGPNFEGKIIEFSLDKPVVGGFIAVSGGRFVSCELNNNVVIDTFDSTEQYPRTECGGSREQIIPPEHFNYGDGEAGKNILECSVGGYYKGFSLTKFSYSIDADNSKVACAINDGITGALQFDDVNDQWLDDLIDEGVACCGDEPTDSGMIVSEPGNAFENTLLCYKDEADDWEWKSASSDTHAFAIKTVDNYDITSNKEQWFTCDENVVNEPLHIGSSVLGRGVKARAAKFLCVKKDEQYIYQECCIPSFSGVDTRTCENAAVSGINRVRTPGEASTSVISSQLSEAAEQSGDIISYRADGTGAGSLDITKWLGYEKLHVVFKVSESYDVFLDLFDESNNLIFSDKLTHYLIDTPRLNEWMHAEIPFDAMPPLKTVNFRFQPEGRPTASYDNTITIGRMYLTPQDSVPLFCTGAQYISGIVPSLWIDDVNADELARNDPTGRTEAEGKSACNGLFAQWTGTECCGDEPGEYYNDTNGACWNSVALDNGDAAMTVEYRADFSTADFHSELLRPPQPFTWEVESRVVPGGGNPEEDALTACRVTYGQHGAQCGKKCFEGTGTCYVAPAAPCTSPNGFTENALCDQEWWQTQRVAGQLYFWVYQADGKCGWYVGARGKDDWAYQACANDTQTPLSACYTFSSGRAQCGSPFDDWFGQAIISLQDSGTDQVSSDASKEISASFSAPGAASYHVTSNNPNVKLVFKSTGTDVTREEDDIIIASTDVIDFDTELNPGVRSRALSYFCAGDECFYPITLTSPLNKHSGVYDLERAIDYVAATRVPRQILFDSGKFYSCFKSPFIDPVGSGLNDDFAAPAAACTTQGDALCSIIELGWGSGVAGTFDRPRDTASPIQPGVNILKNPRFDEE